MRHNQMNLMQRKQNSKIIGNKKSHNSEQELWLYGKHPVFNILQKKRRKVFEILVTKNTSVELENFLKENSLLNLKPLIKLVDSDKIESLIGKNQIHQGIIANCSRLPTKTQNDLLEELYKLEGKPLPTLLLLDQVSDPHNIGAIIRSAAGFGVTKIIFCEHNSPKESATIIKSSAGTVDLVDWIVVTNFSNLMEKLKKIGYWCIGLAGEAKTSISEIKDYKNIALVIGSEGNGLRDLVKKNCDLLAKIEINGEVESLNASVAAAITLYELSRKT
jgi:23S rRNA (guanosine2251-2'-O)-methyltransferase